MPNYPNSFTLLNLCPPTNMLYIKHCDPFKSKASKIISLFKTISFFPRQLRIKSNFCTILSKLCIAWVTSMHLTSAAAGHSSLPLSFLLFGDHTKHIFFSITFSCHNFFSIFPSKALFTRWISYDIWISRFFTLSLFILMAIMIFSYIHSPF